MSSDLLARARAGDAGAFEAVLRPLIEPGYRLAFALLRQREAAEDAVQEAALRAWRSRAKIRPELGTVRPWFLAIVANQGRMARRSRWWSVLRYGVMPEPRGPGDDLETGFDLRLAIERLPHRDRLLVHLYFALDLPVAEVAQVLGIGVGATKSRLHRVVRRLRPELDPQEVLT